MKQRLRSVIVTALAALLAFAAFRALPLGLNVTESLPVGLYWFSPVDRAIARGDLVRVCPDDAMARFGLARGYLPHATDCPSGTITMLKVVVAVPGDIVDVDAGGIRIDGRRLADSRPERTDSLQRPMPALHGPFRLGAEQLWLWTPNPRSFDSRYFGPVSAAQVKRFARLVGPALPWRWSAEVPRLRG